MLSVSVVTLVFYGATAYLCTFLPSDPLHICTSITAYVWNACALSLLGVVGICIVCRSSSRLFPCYLVLQCSPSLVTIFANHLLIDAFVSLIPKLGLVLIVNPHAVCPCTSAFSPLPCCTLQAMYPEAAVVEWNRMETWGLATGAAFLRDCRSVVSTTRVILIPLVIILTVAQCRLSMKVRAFAAKLEL